LYQAVWLIGTFPSLDSLTAIIVTREYNPKITGVALKIAFSVYCCIFR
jgi:hypothetical protein